MITFFKQVMVFLFVPGVLLAQTTGDPGQLIYYERYAGAATELHHRLQADPAGVDNWYLLSKAYLGADRYDALADTLQLAPEAVLSQPLMEAVRGNLLFQKGDSSGAAQLFEQALRETKRKDPRVLAAVASAYINTKAGDAHYALELLEKAIKKDKHNPVLFVLRGDAYRKLINGGEAYNAYEKALTEDPQYAAALYKIGKIYTSQNNPDIYIPYFERAVKADSMYAPALYELYYYNYYKNLPLARKYLGKYIAASDHAIQNDYLNTDMLYASGKYQEAIDAANALLQAEGQPLPPRLYKLKAYSYKELGDSMRAARNMNAYFKAQPDTAEMANDYETMGDIYAGMDEKADSAAYYYAMGAAQEKDTLVKAAFYKKISEIYKATKDYHQEAAWLGKYYAANPSATNVDLFNWGLAHYLDNDYLAADSVFGLYETKFPKEEYGYYWRARTDAAIDTAMETGLAVPHYQRLVKVLLPDTANADSLSETAKNHVVEAYGYIAAYKANAEKDYSGAIDYFEKLLALDPENTDAQRYVAILKKNIARSGSSSEDRNKSAQPR